MNQRDTKKESIIMYITRMNNQIQYKTYNDTCMWYVCTVMLVSISVIVRVKRVEKGTK